MQNWWWCLKWKHLSTTILQLWTFYFFYLCLYWNFRNLCICQHLSLEAKCQYNNTRQNVTIYYMHLTQYWWVLVTCIHTHVYDKAMRIRLHCACFCMECSHVYNDSRRVFIRRFWNEEKMMEVHALVNIYVIVNKCPAKSSHSLTQMTLKTGGFFHLSWSQLIFVPFLWRFT